MKGLSKKLSFSLLALMAAVCFGFGTFFAVHFTTSAQAVSLDKVEYFEISSGGTFSGLSPEGLSAAGNDYFTIELPSTVKQIADKAMLNSTKLTGITIPSGVLTIGMQAFMGCTSLTEIIIPDSVYEINAGAFYGCTSLSNVVLPENLEEINSRLFYGCTSLLTVTIPEKVEYIGDSAFEGCSRLIEVYNKSSLSIVANSSDFGCVGSYALNVYKDANGSHLQPVTQDGYIFYDGEKVYLVDYSGSETNLTLPANYNGKNYEIYLETFKNNTSLESVTVPQSVNAIGKNAFQGCASLKSVTLNNDQLSTLESYVFAGCTSLESIDIPASVSTIQSYAFQNCTSLSEVIFNKYIRTVDQTIEEYLLKTIYSGAFEGCSRLEYIEIPESVTNVQSGAFRGCLNLVTAYLPGSAEFGDNVFPVSYELILIAPDRTSYENYANGSLSNYVTLTYEVEVSLVYGGESHSDYRLYNYAYSYVLQDDGKTWADNGGMPVQEGYKTSVWYSEQTYQNEVDKSIFNNMLSSGSDLTLYADTVEKPALTANKNLVYSGNQISIEEAVGWNSTLAQKFEIGILNYTPCIGTAEVPDKILDAGDYTLGITLKPAYGEWETPCTVPVTVQRAVADLTDFEWASVADNGNATYNFTDLSPVSDIKTLYIYLNGEGKKVPYDEADSTKTPASPATKQIIASYLIYSGSTYTIVLKQDEKYGGNLKVNYTGEYSESEAGVYTIKAEITADNNYIFDFTTDEDAIYRGLSVSGQLTGSETITLSKTWYIVAATTNGLHTGGSDEYNIPEIWTYGGGVPVAPNVKFGNENEIITFTLKRSELNAGTFSVVGEEDMAYEQFEKVINTSMPVGDYILDIKIAQYLAYAGDVVSYNFTVTYAPYSKFNELELEKIYETRNSTTVHFGEINGWDKLDGIEKLHDVPTGDNFWANYPEYYTGFEIYYYVISESGNSGGYYTLADYKGETQNKPNIIPNSVGVYTVYYTVSAPGYIPLAGIGNSKKEDYSYILVVYEELNLAEIQRSIDDLNVLYNGEARMPNIDGNAYRAIYLNDATNPEVLSAMNALGIKTTYDYKNAYDYPVALVIRDNYYSQSLGCYLYRWEGWEENPTRMYVSVTLTVGKAHNNTRTALIATEWEWGSYDPAKNAISWSTDWVNDAEQFVFELVSTTNPDKSYIYNYGEGINEFGDADYGYYYLRATCPAGVNYEAGYEETVIYIRPAEITWLSAPYVESWKYGDYKKMFMAPMPTLSSSVSALEQKVLDSALFYYADEYGKPGATGYSSMLALIEASGDAYGEAPAGKYVLVYSSVAQGNYAKFEYVVNFQVFKADNYWDVTPVVNGWAYGDKAIDYLTYKPDCAPHFGDAQKVVIQYRKLDENFGELSGWEYTLADLGLDEYGKLSIGNYEIKATLSGSNNYDSMEFTMRFVVTRAQNSWDEIPNVISWSAGRIKSVEDFLKAVPANGTALITITDKNGKVIIEDEILEDINLNKLKSLSAGSYVLKAYVAGSDKYEELVAYVDFAIFEDAVSQNAVIALTIVFAVIAIGLAVVGVVLLVRRDKQIEEEFRKMIKSELRRK